MTATRLDRLADRFSEDAADKHLRKVDRRYWALYRTLDLSQSDVQEFVKTFTNTSQATVSRAIRSGDTRVLVEPDFVELGGGFDEEDLPDGSRPEVWFEAYRDVLATAVTDCVALEVIASEQRQTPEWAARRFPELVGCNKHVADYWEIEVSDFATDEHLNRLDSVNTDKWE